MFGPREGAGGHWTKGGEKILRGSISSSNPDETIHSACMYICSSSKSMIMPDASIGSLIRHPSITMHEAELIRDCIMWVCINHPGAELVSCQPIEKLANYCQLSFLGHAKSTKYFPLGGLIQVFPFFHGCLLSPEVMVTKHCILVRLCHTASAVLPGSSKQLIASQAQVGLQTHADCPQ